jgi:hypothetical protein
MAPSLLLVIPLLVSCRTVLLLVSFAIYPIC